MRGWLGPSPDPGSGPPASPDAERRIRFLTSGCIHTRRPHTPPQRRAGAEIAALFPPCENAWAIVFRFRLEVCPTSPSPPYFGGEGGFSDAPLLSLTQRRRLTLRLPFRQAGRRRLGDQPRRHRYVTVRRHGRPDRTETERAARRRPFNQDRPCEVGHLGVAQASYVFLGPGPAGHQEIAFRIFAARSLADAAGNGHVMLLRVGQPRNYRGKEAAPAESFRAEPIAGMAGDCPG